jgi:integrase
MANYTIYERNDVLQIRINGGLHNHNIRFSLGVPVTGLKYDKEKNKCLVLSERGLNTNNTIRDVVGVLDRLLSSGNTLTLEYIKKSVLEVINPNKYQVVNNEEGNLFGCIKAYINYCKSGGTKSSTSLPMSSSTIKLYEEFIDVYEEFLQVHNDINLYNVSVHTITDLIERKKRVGLINQHLIDFKQHLIIEKELHPNSQYLYLVRLVAVINWYAQKEVLVIQYEVPAKHIDTEKVFLDPEDIKVIFNNYHIRERLSARNKFYFDFSLIALTTALRRNDILFLKPTDFKKVSGKFFVTNWNHKTKVDTLAQIPEFIYNIVQENVKSFGHVLGYFDDCYVKCLSVMIKKTFDQPEFEGLQREHTKNIMSPDGKTQKQKTKKLYEFITPHVFRRSAITTMLVSGVDEGTVKKMSGHVRDSEAFNVYVGHVQSHFEKEGNKYLDFIGS